MVNLMLVDPMLA